MEESRRPRLGLVLAAAAILFAASPVRAAVEGQPASRSFTVVSVGPGIYAAVAKAGNRASVGNAGFVIGSAGVLVVDTFASPAAAEELVVEIQRRTRAPIRWVVNTHHHLDHVGGNAVFARAGASILAHENARVQITPDKAVPAALVLPDLTHTSGVSIWLGDRRADILERPGHTGGDSVVVLRDANVLFAGDLFWKNTVPNLVDANTEAWAETLGGFLRDSPATTFVPGHGEVGKALDVRFFRDYLSGLRLSVVKGMEEGKSGRALVESLLPRHRERYGSWRWFGEYAEKNIERTEGEIRGAKSYPPTPPPKTSPAPPEERAVPVPTASPPA